MCIPEGLQKRCLSQSSLEVAGGMQWVKWTGITGPPGKPYRNDKARARLTEELPEWNGDNTGKGQHPGELGQSRGDGMGRRKLWGHISNQSLPLISLRLLPWPFLCERCNRGRVSEGLSTQAEQGGISILRHG